MMSGSRISACCINRNIHLVTTSTWRRVFGLWSRRLVPMRPVRLSRLLASCGDADHIGWSCGQTRPNFSDLTELHAVSDGGVCNGFLFWFDGVGMCGRCWDMSLVESVVIVRVRGDFGLLLVKAEDNNNWEWFTWLFLTIWHTAARFTRFGPRFATTLLSFYRGDCVVISP
jgi:hypothetical protein